MRLNDITTDVVETLEPTQTLEAAVQLMRDRDIGWMPVLEKEKIVGVVTDRDIVIRGVASGMQPKTNTVGEVMTKNVLSCDIEDAAEDAARLMEREQVRRLVVTDRIGRLVGVVSLADFARSGDEERSSEVLERVTQPA